MIVVQLNSEAQTVNVLPRYYEDINTANVSITFTNEDTREDVDLGAGVFTKSDGFLSFDVVTLSGHSTENCTFKVKITATIDSVANTSIFRGLLFVTNQTPQDYSIYG